MSTITYPHVEITAEGVPMLAGTPTKVLDVVLDRLAHHWDADQIQRQHPHLSLSEIHAALAYYYDHRAEMDQEIENQLADVARIKARVGESALRLKLRASGELP